SRSTHGDGLVAGNYSERFGSSRRFPGKVCKILSRVIIACTSNGDIFGDDRVAFLFELARDDCLERFRFNPEQLERRAERSSVDRQLVALGQFLHRHGAKLDTLCRFPGRDLLFVVNGGRAALQQMQVPIHRVLIERNEGVDLVTHVADRPVTGADCQESVASADDRLVRVVSVEMQPAPRKDKRENVPSGSDPLAVLTANADCEINFVHYAEPVFCCSPRKFAAPNANKQAKARMLGAEVTSTARTCALAENRRGKSPRSTRSFSAICWPIPIPGRRIASCKR